MMKPQNIGDVQTALNNYLKSGSLTNPNDRYKSWEHCYRAFGDAVNMANSGNWSKIDYDYLCLILSEYLSSWGMRRNSFLLDLDYKAHEEAVRKIIDGSSSTGSPFRSLFSVSTAKYLKTSTKMLDTLFDLKKTLTDIYQNKSKAVAKNNKNFASAFGIKPKSQIKPTDTLISKIILGTLGACPAYDRNLRAALKSGPIASSMFSRNSIKELSKFYRTNLVNLNKSAASFQTSLGMPYPEMKLLDLAFWLCGM